MGKGYLKVSVTTGSGALPVAGANVTVADAQGNILYRLVTDEDGNTGKVEINAPDKAVDLDPDYVGDYYAVCDVKIEAENYDTVIVNGVQIFDTVTTILPVNMAPVLEEGAQPEYAVRIDIPAPAIISEEHTHQSNGQTRQDPAGITPAIQGDVKIPERIRVQQGAPNAIANVVSVTFPDYIKNVCSSEIFPTWPDASLEANIYCQISLALNRIFTEWYPSQGKYFDITNNTGWDQAFTYGRNIYDNISVMVDRIFNRFVRREGHKEPFYTEYCDGKKATCPGLKQWGTVDLANRGYTPIQILRYYYPKDIQLVETNNIAPVQESYPGYPLSQGMSGAPVRTIQDQLNRIRVNFPLIPQIVNPNGFFGADTANSVRAFQREFSLPIDGVVGRGTWFKSSYIYTAVKKLAELTSEGIIIGVGRTPPTSTVSQGSRGRDVGILQYLLNYIADFYPGVPSVIWDYSFGAATRSAVLAFQSQFGLTPDGVVGPGTWNKLYSVYWGVRDNVNVPLPPPSELPPFPGSPLRIGSFGPAVLQVQTCLNRIATFHPEINRVVADSSFGPATEAAVIAFQRIHGLTDDGVVGPATWNAIMLECGAEGGGGGPSTMPPFPGTLLRLGSSGADVRQIQYCLNRVRTANPSIPNLAEDGQFGPITQSAVITFQRIFGLSPDGVVGPITWNRLMEACASAGPPPSRPPFPGFLIGVGASGSHVLQIQQCLNRVAAIYTSIPRVTEDSVFGNMTKNSVIAFQIIARLTPDGVVGAATWNSLMDYCAISSTGAAFEALGADYVTPTAECWKEALAGADRWNNSKDGAAGSDGWDGFIGDLYGANTPADGVTGWDMPMDEEMYGWNLPNNGANNWNEQKSGKWPSGWDMPGSPGWDKPTGNTPTDGMYADGAAKWRPSKGGDGGWDGHKHGANNRDGLKPGARGDDVLRLQQGLNAVSQAYGSLPRLAEDGVYGPHTAYALREFQRMFGVKASGAADEATLETLARELRLLEQSRSGHTGAASPGMRPGRPDTMPFARPFDQGEAGQGGNKNIALMMLMRRMMGM